LVAENLLAYGLLRARVPADEAAYRLEAELDRAGFAEASTQVSAAWTLASKPVDADEKR
jgi:hypothetical protein